MGNRGTADHKIWLEDLAQDNISPERMVKGFIQFYVLEENCMGDVFDDIMLQTSHGYDHAEKARARLKTVLGQVVDGTMRLEADA